VRAEYVMKKAGLVSSKGVEMALELKGSMTRD
jgi:hypothetical protein